MKQRDLQTLAKRLAHLAQMMSAGVETTLEAEQFHSALEAALSLPANEETVVQAMALSGLGELGDDESMNWLIEEFEIEAVLQNLPNAAGRERSCLLFAIPVVIPESDIVNTHADHEMLAEVHEVLQEADVIDQSADFGLVTRLFSYSELFSRSFGELRRLNRYLAEQVLRGESVLMLPHDDFEISQVLDGASATPGVDLFFIVGMAVTRPGDLENIFPQLSNDVDESGGGFEKEKGFQVTDDGVAVAYDIGESGMTNDGKPWENAFCQAFDDAWGAIEGALTVLPPDGLAEDLRRGLELAREVGLCQMFERNFEDPASQRWSRLSFLQESEGEVWFDVHCLSAPTVEPMETMRWPVLNHETEEDSLQKLLDSLLDEGIEQENPPHAPNMVGSMLLH